MSTSSERAHRAAAATSVVINPGAAVGDGADDCAVRLAAAEAAAAQAIKAARQAAAVAEAAAATAEAL